MRIPLNRQLEVPLYQQIENFIRASILSGGLEPETRLPATRQLARDLGVNRITVETAYAGLEADGLIYSKIGSGTYVLPLFPIPSKADRENKLPWAEWQQDLIPEDAHEIRTRPGESFVTDENEDLIDFASGLGAQNLFPTEEFRKVLQTVMRRKGIQALGYGERQGLAPLRSTIAQVLTRQGLIAQPENILITGGSQQAIALVAQRFLKAGDSVVIEKPTYTGAIDLFANLGVKIVEIPVDEDGMQVKGLESVLKKFHPKLIYTIPTFQNPTGTCMSGARRRFLVALAQRHNIPILEDDFVGDLRYEGRAQPALKALDQTGNVIYVSTFSKMLMPGLRVGFLVAEGPVYAALVDFKSIQDLATSNLIQHALEAFVSVGRYQAHLRRACQLYRQRRDLMLNKIDQLFPPNIKWIHPRGGLFLWLMLPEGISSNHLLEIARGEGVNFSPGSNYFWDRNEGTGFLRLNFAVQSPEQIEEGILRLSRALAIYQGKLR